MNTVEANNYLLLLVLWIATPTARNDGSTVSVFASVAWQSILSEPRLKRFERLKRF